MSERFVSRRHSRNEDTAFPPTATEISSCPPHHWVLEKGYQWCRKCNERRDSDGDRPGAVAGAVTRIIIERGVGYVKDATGREYFFNRSGVRDNGFSTMVIGQEVEFEPGYGSQMGGRAMNVRILPVKVAAE